jgi:hypothetical protein
MIFNPEMFGMLLGISAGTWLLVNRLFAKAAVKMIVKSIYDRYLVTVDPIDGKQYSLEKIERLAVLVVVAIVAVFLTILAHATNMYVEVQQVGEFQYAGSLPEVTFIKCFWQIEPVRYGLLWYADIIFTIAFIIAGSQLMHRIEKYFDIKYQFVKG